MSTDTNEKKQIAELILGIKNDPKRKSTLQLALEIARFHLGMDVSDKVPNNEDRNNNTFPNYGDFITRHHFVERIKENASIDRCSDEAELFTALFLYLNVLEQIGTLFCKDEKNGIEKAIETFSSQELPAQDIKEIKNLRNSLAHNFGLINLKNQSPTIKYTISIDYHETNSSNNAVSNCIIQLPKNEWSKDWSDKSDETSCTIYAFPLMRLCEDIIKEVVERCKEDKLTFAIEELEEIKARYTILI